MNEISEKEETAVNFIIEMLKEKKLYNEKRHDKFLILRFLKARDFELHQTTTMIAEFEKWRVDVDIDTIVQT
jgi:hypothetical protein